MRRGTALIMLWFAGSAVAITVLAGLTTALHYPALTPIAHPFLAILVAAVMAIIALRGVLPESTERVVAQACTGLFAVVVAVVAALVHSAGEFSPRQPEVVATGTDVRVVSWRQDDVPRRHLRLRLRSRAGLFSRDGTTDVACFLDEGGAYPDWTFASATVTGDLLVARTADGQEWRVKFDPETLRPTTPAIDRCTAAPGYSD
ncbi:hypothetical protein ACFPIJ_34550 [Dactylosporangium cerinum]|uniref:Uncharacterized protein n=1 Tax=Dactylosporangium cerinum TaxID=1434730 RepID=A0ABV9W2Y2_9ACTN